LKIGLARHLSVFALNGSFPPFDPFLGGNEPFPPEPCRSIPFFNAFPPPKQKCIGSGRAKGGPA